MRRLPISPRRAWLCCVMTVSVMVLADVDNAQAADARDAIPDAASLVIRWKTPQPSLENLSEFVEAVQPGMGETIRGSLPRIGEILGNPGFKGVRTDQDLWAIVFQEPQVLPTIVYVMTAKDADDVKDALPVNFHVHVEGKIVAYSEDEDALEMVRQRLAGERKSIWPRIDDASRQLMDAADLSLLINVRQLVEDFADELDQAEPLFEAILEDLSDTVPDAQRGQIEPLLDMYKKLGSLVIRGLRDSNSLVVGVSVAKSSLRIEKRLQFTSGTAAAKEFSTAIDGELRLIDKLPAGQPVYVGLKANVNSLVEWSMSFARTTLANGTNEQKSELEAASKAARTLKFEELALYMNVGLEAPVLRTGAVTLVTPAQEWRDIARRIAKAFSEVQLPGMTQQTVLEPGVDKIGGGEVDHVTVTQKFEDSDAEENQKKMLDLLFGEAGMQQWLLYQTNRVAQTMGGGKAELQNLVTALDAASSNPSVTELRGHFFKKANVLVLIDLPRLVLNGLTVAVKHQLIPLDEQSFDDIKLDPSFIGIAIAGQDGAIGSQLEIPALQIINLSKLFQKINQLR